MFNSILRLPDYVEVQTSDGWRSADKKGEEFISPDSAVKFDVANTSVDIILAAATAPISRIRVRWDADFTLIKRMLGDSPGVEFGDLGWMPVIPEKHWAWYIQCYDGKSTHCYGVKTGCNSFCFWQLDPEGVTLTLDVRNGGDGLVFREAILCASVVERCGREDEIPFYACQDFCKLMCEKPNLPKRPIFGLNNWYYAYGNISRESVLTDTAITAELCSGTKHRPFMLIDDGWQILHNGYNGGPFVPSAKFGNMQELAHEMSEMGCEPGLWIRPLLTKDKFASDLYHPRGLGADGGLFLDPSKKDVLDYVALVVSGVAKDGYKMIKYDFTAPDMLTADIYDEIYIKENITDTGWHFDDRSVTNAQICKCLYETIQDAAGDTLIMSCNTYNHLTAGIHQIQRSGLDTSGFDWNKTRKMGVNSLAFRLPQNNTFFITDPDCAAITENVPKEMNLRFFEACALSGTSLFISVTPGMLTEEEKARLNRSFKIADNGTSMEPLDWFDNTCPRRYIADGKEYTFNWFDKTNGVNIY